MCLKKTVVPFSYAGMIQIRFPGCVLSPAFSDRTPPTEVIKICRNYAQNAIAPGRFPHSPGNTYPPASLPLSLPVRMLLVWRRAIVPLPMPGSARPQHSSTSSGRQPCTIFPASSVSDSSPTSSRP